MTVLALDLGTRTGWALHGADQPITSGTVLFKNDRWQGGGITDLLVGVVQETGKPPVGGIWGRGLTVPSGAVP